MTDILNSIWVEKYRPKKVEELVLPVQYTEDFKRMISKCEIPNLLFSGPPGGGKTTISRVLCSKHGVLFNNNDNLLSVNGSSRKSRGIGFVDDVIEPFLKHPPARDKYKIVFIDEADKLTIDGYDSLRALIEKYNVDYGRFIFTCNYLSRIPDPIQSRFTSYVFSRIPKEFVLDFCKKILGLENIEYSDEDIKVAIVNLYPDVRKIVNILQKSSLDGKLKILEKDVITNERKVITFIRQILSFIEKGQSVKIGGVVNSIVEILSAQELEYRNVYTDLFFGENIPAPAKIIINKYSNGHQNALVPHMHFMAMVFEIIRGLQEYKKSIVGN